MTGGRFRCLDVSVSVSKTELSDYINDKTDQVAFAHRNLGKYIERWRDQVLRKLHLSDHLPGQIEHLATANFISIVEIES